VARHPRRSVRAPNNEPNDFSSENLSAETVRAPRALLGELALHVALDLRARLRHGSRVPAPERRRAFARCHRSDGPVSTPRCRSGAGVCWPLTTRSPCAFFPFGCAGFRESAVHLDQTPRSSICPTSFSFLAARYSSSRSILLASRRPRSHRPLAVGVVSRRTMPHSKPAWTSRTSVLEARSDGGAIRPSRHLPSRTIRSVAPRRPCRRSRTSPRWSRRASLNVSLTSTVATVFSTPRARAGPPSRSAGPPSPGR